MQKMKLIIVIAIKVVFFDYCIVSVCCVNGKHPVYNEKSRQWADEDKIKLLKIFYETNTGERNHANRIKERWDQLDTAKRTCSAHNLYTRSLDWIEKGEADRLLTEEKQERMNPKERKSRTKWTSQMKEDILRIYKKSNPKKWNQSKRMKELWDSKYPDHSEVTAHHLMLQVRNLRNKHGKVIRVKKKSFTAEEMKDLLRCHHMAVQTDDKQLKVMRDLFIMRHPEYADVSCDTLYVRMSKFRKQYPEINEEISKDVSASNMIHHSWESRGASESKWEGTPSFSAFQSHDSPRLSKQYLDPNHSYSSKGASVLKREGSASSSSFHSHGLPGVSEQYFDPNRDNAWIDHMIREGSFLSEYAFPNVDVSHQTIHRGHIEDHIGWESKQDHLGGG